MRLGDVAAVRSGLVLSRKQSRTKTQYRYRLINLRSINQDGYIDLDSLDPYDATERLNYEYLTHSGDVVIRLTTPYTAVLIDDTTSDMVFSSNFVVIRPDSSRILPEYLYWLLNTPKVKRKIYENTSSNMLGAIKPRYFSEFEITSLPIEEQQKIAVLNLLANKECQLLNELATEKKKYYSYTINEIQKQMRRGNRHDD